VNPYVTMSSGACSHEVTELSARLSKWHDAMVAHERRLRAGSTSDRCDEECPHAEARALWAEALRAFGARALALTFLRSRGNGPRRPQTATAANHAGDGAAAAPLGRRGRGFGETALPTKSIPSAVAATEL
jgi:hypothetical protein